MWMVMHFGGDDSGGGWWWWWWWWTLVHQIIGLGARQKRIIGGVLQYRSRGAFVAVNNWRCIKRKAITCNKKIPISHTPVGLILKSPSWNIVSSICNVLFINGVIIFGGFHLRQLMYWGYIVYSQYTGGLKWKSWIPGKHDDFIYEQPLTIGVYGVNFWKTS